MRDNRDFISNKNRIVGTNDKDTYQPEHSEEEARKIVDQICLRYFEGYTLQEATGSQTDCIFIRQDPAGNIKADKEKVHGEN